MTHPIKISNQSTKFLFQFPPIKPVSYPLNFKPLKETFNRDTYSCIHPKSRWTRYIVLNGSTLQVYSQITILSYMLSSSNNSRRGCTSIYMEVSSMLSSSPSFSISDSLSIRCILSSPRLSIKALSSILMLSSLLLYGSLSSESWLFGPSNSSVLIHLIIVCMLSEAPLYDYL